MSQPLTDRIKDVIEQQNQKGEYATVRFISKKLGIKMKDVIENLPPNAVQIPSNSGALGEYRIRLSSDAEDTPVANVNQAQAKKEEKEPMEEQVVENVQEEKGEITAEVEGAVQGNGTGEGAEQPKAKRPVPDPDRPTCIVCEDKMRTGTQGIRGVCPLCFQQMSRDSGRSQKEIEELPEEEFQGLLNSARQQRQALQDLMESRKLTPEEFIARKDDLVTIGHVVQVARSMGIGVSRVVKATGGDQMRHEPESLLWTPYYVGGRMARYLDREVLNHLEEIRPQPKPKKEKKASEGGKRGRGKAMKVVEGEVETSTEDEGADEELA